MTRTSVVSPTRFLFFMTHTDRTVHVCFIVPVSSTNVKRPFFSVFYCCIDLRGIVGSLGGQLESVTQDRFTLNLQYDILFIIVILPILAFI